MSESQTTPTFRDGKESQNLRELLESRVEATPDKNFLFAEVHGWSFTYREFDEMVNRTANMLLSHGIGKGDTVSLLMPNKRQESSPVWTSPWRVIQRSSILSYY